MKRRLLSFVLAFAMLLSVTPVAVFATGSTFVAEVGEGSYKTLAAAIDKAENGDTIKLLADVNEAVTFGQDIAVTLDLNGNTVSSGGDTITVTAGEVIITDSGDGSGMVTSTSTENYTGPLYVKGGNVTLKKGTLSGAASGVYIDDGGNFTMEDGIVEYTTAGDWHIGIMVWDATSNLTIKGGTVRWGEGLTNGWAIYCCEGQMNIEGGSFYGPVFLYTGNGATGGITGGTFYDHEQFLSAVAEGYAAEGDITNGYVILEIVEKEIFGEGTETEPYQIKTPQDLMALAYNVNYGIYTDYIYVELVNDIDMAGIAWTPIGASYVNGRPLIKVPFIGSFEGNNKTISNLHVSAVNGSGLFGATQGAVISNLKIDRPTGKLGNASGTVVGYGAIGANELVLKMTNVHVTNANLTGYGTYIGGLVGHSYGASMTNCSFSGALDAPGSAQVAGLLGSGGLTATGCSVNATITAWAAVGGMVGNAQENTSIKNSAITGTFEATGYGIGAAIGLANSAKEVSDNTFTNVSVQSPSSVGSIIGAESKEVATVSGNTLTNVTVNGAPSSAANTIGDRYGVAAMIGNTEYDSLQNAIDAAEAANTKDIVIDLVNDATLDITAWQTLAIGGEDTETITINGNGHTLVFNKKDSDWNHVITNNNAKLILNNMTLDDSGYNDGPWNRYDINFACDVELNDVVSKKALAFKADATLNTVTVNESGDNYAIWIQANGQTVVADGLKVNAENGRGIKIDKQYGTDAAKVNLTVTNADFTTDKKAAILVETASGADISVANVDISKVAADHINVVWVDEDAKEYFTKVTVNGGRPVIESTKGPIEGLSYVSLGASNTNGFGLIGYLPDDLYGNPVNKMTGSVYGYKMEPDEAYPALVAAALQTKTGRAVALEQLAISSMRAEELHVLLDNDYYGDKYTEWRFTKGQNWFNMAHPAGLNGLRAEYQNFVANADLITVDIGANNFGVYASNHIFNNMFDADFTKFDAGTQQDIAKVKGEIKQILDTYAAGVLTPALSGMLDHIVDTMTYALVGFCVNFDASMERIYELNPDATVVVVNIQNLMHGLYATLPGLDQPFAFGEFYGAIVNMANAYIASGSPYSDRYFCAYIGADGQAETFLKDIQDYTGNPADLRTAVTDCFDVYDNSMYVKTRVLQVLLREYKDLVSVNSPYTKDEILDDSDTGLEKFSTAVYENEITIADVVTVQEFLAYGAAGNLPGELQNAYNLYNTALLTVYDTAATFMQLGANSTVMDLAAAAANFATQGKAVLQTMFAMLEESIVKPGLKIEETPEFQALANDPTAMAIITLGVRSDLGNSFFSHPNENGHEEIKNAILAAVENEIKGDDLVMNELVDAMQFASDYIRAHYNEIYYNAWNLAKAQGFVDMANGYIDQVEAVISSIDYSALADKTHLIHTLDVLKAEVLGDVDALRDLINNPNHPTAGEITALMNELNNDLIALQNVAAQADIDAVAQLIALHKQIMKQYDIAYNQACTYICEQLGQAYDVIVAELTRIVAEQNAAAAELLAKYLGENPADLIQTILEYGYNVDAFINKWSYHAQMLLGPAWNEYGEDITAFVQENIAKLLSSLKAEAGNLSAEAANALLSYIDDLKITENVYAIASQLQNGGMQIGWNTLTELEAIVNGLNDQLIVNAAAAIQALEALAASQDAAAAKAIIDAAIAEIRTTEAERMAAIDAIYANILSAKAALTTAVDAINDLQSAAQVLGSLIENPAAFNFDSAVEAITTLLNELDAAVATVKAATAQIVTLTNDVSVTAQAICREAAASKTQVMDALYTAETVLQTSGVATETLMRNAYAAAEAYVVGTLNKVNADMVSLLTLCNTELQSAVNNVVTAVNTCLYNATHGEYEIDRFSKYVALGGNAAYADELAALLGLSDRYVKMALTDNYLAEVAGADLVTVKMDNGEFLTFARNQIMGMAAELITGNEDLMKHMNNSIYGDVIKEYIGQYIDLNAKAQVLDWNAYLDARAQGVLRESLANVKTLMLQDSVPEVYVYDAGAVLTELLNGGSVDDPGVVVNLVIEIPVADLAVAAIENALYGYVRFANEFTSVLNTIHAVSPEAEVVVTGIQNPVIGLTLNVEGTEVNVGEYAEYVQYVVDALNLHLYAYALATDNTTYVGGNTAADILNALTVTKAPLLGDANNDGVVDSYDVTLILQYLAEYIGRDDINYAACDVDGDGLVDSYDATLILQYLAEYISFFPAEIR